MPTKDRSAFDISGPLPATLVEYEAEVMHPARSLHNGDMEFAMCHALGITEEAGEVAGLLKKRRFHGKTVTRDALATEMGDVIWYVAANAKTWGIPFAGIVERATQEDAAYIAAGYGGRTTPESFASAMCERAGWSGVVAETLSYVVGDDYAKAPRSIMLAVLAPEIAGLAQGLADTLRLLRAVGRCEGITLDDAARANAHKLRVRFPSGFNTTDANARRDEAKPDAPRRCNLHGDCDAANAKARESGRLGADHCHDEGCEDCYGK